MAAFQPSSFSCIVPGKCLTTLPWRRLKVSFSALDLRFVVFSKKWVGRLWLVDGFNISHFHPYLGKWSNLTNIFAKGLKPPTRWAMYVFSKRFKFFLFPCRWCEKSRFHDVFDASGLFGGLFGSKKTPIWIRDESSMVKKAGTDQHFCIENATFFYGFMRNMDSFHGFSPKAMFRQLGFLGVVWLWSCEAVTGSGWVSCRNVVAVIQSMRNLDALNGWTSMGRWSPHVRESYRRCVNRGNLYKWHMLS